MSDSSLLTSHRPEQYLAFGREVLSRVCERIMEEISGEDDEAIARIALKHGLIQRVKYDPKTHGDALLHYVKAGDDIWWWAESAPE